MESTPAKNRGAMIRLMGSTAIISIADNCSVVFISPISAVIAEPARLANNNPETTGPSSRTSESATSTPAEFAATIKADMAKWGKLIKDSGIRE